MASLLSGATLLGMQQYILSPSYNGTKQLVRLLPPPPYSSIMLRRKYIQANRFLLLYGIATSCVLLWRGTWLLWDEAAHWIADSIEDGFFQYSHDGSFGANNEEKMEMEAIKGLTISSSMVPTTTTTQDNGKDGAATTKTTTQDNGKDNAATITKVYSLQRQSQNHSISSSTPTPTNHMDKATATTDVSDNSIPSSSIPHHHHAHHFHHHHEDNDPHHHEHEDHHGESSVTQHTDITDKTLFYSGIASHIIATVILLSMGRFVSVMAPPANVTLLKDHFLHERGKKFAKAARKFMEHPKE